MEIVVDTNIIFSAVLSKNSKFREILSNKNFKFISPKLLQFEIFNHIDKLLKYSKQTSSETLYYLDELLSLIKFYNLEIIPYDIMEFSYNICKKYDASDTPFVALSLYKNAKFWTGDKIKNHLIKNGFNNFFELT